MSTPVDHVALTHLDEDHREGARRAPRISRDDVFAAADALLLKGDRPTIDRIRMHLGRGSPNTINDHLDAWWGKLGARLRDLPGQELPGVPAPISSTLVSLWSEAIDHARLELRETLNQQFSVAEQARTALGEREAALKQEQTRLAIERTALEQTLAVLRSQLTESQDRLRLGRERIETLEGACAQLEGQREQMHQEFTALREQFERARAEHQEALRGMQERADESERHWVCQVDEARQTLDAERKSAHAQETQWGTERTRLRTELADTHAALGQSRLQLAQVTEARDALASENSHLKQQHQSQQAKMEAMWASLQDTQAAALARLESLQRQLQEAWSRSAPTDAADPAGPAPRSKRSRRRAPSR